MAYATADEYRAWLSEFTGGVSVNWTQPQLAAVNNFLADAQTYIEDYTNRWFEARTLTRSFNELSVNAWDSSLLCVDADLLTVTAITNGTGEVIATSNVLLWPYNDTPKTALKLKSGLAWSFANDGLVNITGTWGYMATPDNTVKRMLFRVAWWIQNTRSATGQVTAFADGTRTYESALPQDVMTWLMRHQRRTTYR
jgi:hypothetical protein